MNNNHALVYAKFVANLKSAAKYKQYIRIGSEEFRATELVDAINKMEKEKEDMRTVLSGLMSQ